MVRVYKILSSKGHSFFSLVPPEDVSIEVILFHRDVTEIGAICLIGAEEYLEELDYIDYLHYQLYRTIIDQAKMEANQ